MFDVGFSELVMVGLVGLLAVGPQRLPGVAREAALWLRKLRSLIADTQADIKRELALDELQALDELRSAANRRIDPMASLRDAVTAPDPVTKTSAVNDHER